MDEKQLKALLSKTLNIDDSKFAELVKTDDDGKVIEIELDKILDLDKERVKSLKLVGEDLGKERHKNGLSQGKSEALGLHEKELKEKFNLTSEKKGIDLVDEIIKANTKSPKDGDMTPENIKVSTTYLDMVEKMEGNSKTSVEDATKPLQEKIKGFERQSVLNVVNQKANGIIDSLNPRFSEDKVKASNQRKVILERLSGLNYKVDGERITLLNEEGERLVDEHDIPVKFEEKVGAITTNLYDLNESKPRSGGGDDEEEEEGKGDKPFKWNKQTPKDQADYQKKLKAADSFEERKAIMKSWTDKDT